MSKEWKYPNDKQSSFVSLIPDEFKGHCLLESARQADLARLKKYLTPDIASFKHPYTGDTALVCSGMLPRRLPVATRFFYLGGTRTLTDTLSLIKDPYRIPITYYKHTLLVGQTRKVYLKR